MLPCEACNQSRRRGDRQGGGCAGCPTSASNSSRLSPTPAQLNRATASSRAAAPRRARSSAQQTASTIAAANPAPSSGSTSHPVSPSFTIDAGPPRFTAITGQPTRHRLHQHLAELLVDRSVDEDVACRKEVGKVLVVVPAGEEDAGHPEALDGLDRVLALPLAWVAAEKDERGRLVELDPGLRVGLDQEREALDLGEAAAVDEGRALERVEIRLLVARRCRAALPGASPAAPRPGASATALGGRPRAA